MQQQTDGVVVVLSGGQDSTTCLYWAKQEFEGLPIHALSFDYGQKHHIELQSAKKISQLAKVVHKIIPINSFAHLGNNALTGDQPLGQNSESNLPTSFVPGRNLIFLSFAAAYAYSLGFKQLVTGVAQTDYSGYPDCREETIQSLEQTINLGIQGKIKIHTPLMFKSKKETVLLARQLGAMDALAFSHTCYLGQVPPCGSCPACLLRAKGFAEAEIADPLIVYSQKELS